VTTLVTGRTPGSCTEALDDDVDLGRDRELVERAQAGDRAAFDDLYVRYYRRLYRFCLRRLQDPHEAEDVAQEAFARAWRALPNFAGDRRFYPWLSVIAAHLCTDVLRRRNRSTPVAEFHQGHVVSTEDGGEERVVAAVDSELVAQAFTRLSDRHQRILSLREGSGWSYQMIADHEGVGITAIETLLWRARQALKREFSALAGADGRLAGIVGAVVGLAAVRRWLSRLAQLARRCAAGSWGPTTAATSLALASTALILGVAHFAHAPATVRGVAAAEDHAVPSGGPAANTGAHQTPQPLRPAVRGAAANAIGARPEPDAGRGAGLAAVATVARTANPLVAPLIATTSQLGHSLSSIGTALGNVGHSLDPTAGTLHPAVSAVGQTLGTVPGLSGSSVMVRHFLQTLELLLLASDAHLHQLGSTVGAIGTTTTSAAASAALGGSPHPALDATCTARTTLGSVTSLVGSLAGAAPSPARCP
jgi:RNA polymerase sigma-70 factor (ECF subfamily)